MTPNRGKRAVSPLHALWLLVFAVDAALTGREPSTRWGAVVLGSLFAALLVTELRSYRRDSLDGAVYSESDAA